MHGKLDEVKRPFAEQLTAMDWHYLACDLDTPDVRQDIQGPVTPRRSGLPQSFKITDFGSFLRWLVGSYC